MAIFDPTQIRFSLFWLPHTKTREESGEKEPSMTLYLSVTNQSLSFIQSLDVVSWRVRKEQISVDYRPDLLNEWHSIISKTNPMARNLLNLYTKVTSRFQNIPPGLSVTNPVSQIDEMEDRFIWKAPISFRGQLDDGELFFFEAPLYLDSSYRDCTHPEERAYMNPQQPNLLTFLPYRREKRERPCPLSHLPAPSQA